LLQLSEPTDPGASPPPQPRKHNIEEAAKAAEEAAKQSAEIYQRIEEAAAEDNKEGDCSHQQQALEAYANSPRKPWETWVNTKRPWDAQMKALTDAVNERCSRQPTKNTS
jgi:hypothetical protein